MAITQPLAQSAATNEGPHHEMEQHTGDHHEQDPQDRVGPRNRGGYSYCSHPRKRQRRIRPSAEWSPTGYRCPPPIR